MFYESYLFVQVNVLSIEPPRVIYGLNAQSLILVTATDLSGDVS